MTRGIPAQNKAINERLDAVESTQMECQRVLDVEVLPVLTETVDDVRALTRAVKALSKKVDSLRRARK